MISDIIGKINVFLDEKVKEIPLYIPLEGDDLIFYQTIAKAQKAVMDLSVPLLLLEYNMCFDYDGLFDDKEHITYNTHSGAIDTEWKYWSYGILKSEGYWY